MEQDAISGRALVVPDRWPQQSVDYEGDRRSLMNALTGLCGKGLYSLKSRRMLLSTQPPSVLNS